jgi:hypothetical protein
MDIPETVLFREEIGTAIYHGLHVKPNLVNEASVRKFTLYWAAYDSGLAALPSHFSCSGRDGNKFPSVLRLDLFLYIDQESFVIFADN